MSCKFRRISMITIVTLASGVGAYLLFNSLSENKKTYIMIDPQRR